MKSIVVRLLALVAISAALVGCENDNSTVVTNEAPEAVYNLPTNGTATVSSVSVNGNQNSILLYVETSPGVTQVIDVDVFGNSNIVGIIYTQPVLPVFVPTGPPEDPAAP